MSSRSLLTVTIMLGAALTGASIAVTSHLQPETMQRVAQMAQPAMSAFRVAPVIQSSPQPLPQAAAQSAAPIAASPANPLRSQIQQAIRERNLTLLKSLIQAGALPELKSSERANFEHLVENLDASAWKILEKAVGCRTVPQTADPTRADSTVCFGQ